MQSHRLFTTKLTKSQEFANSQRWTQMTACHSRVAGNPEHEPPAPPIQSSIINPKRSAHHYQTLGPQVSVLVRAQALSLSPLPIWPITPTQLWIGTEER